MAYSGNTVTGPVSANYPRDPTYKKFQGTTHPGFPENFQSIDQISPSYTFSHILDVKNGTFSTSHPLPSDPGAPIVIYETASDIRIAFYGLKKPTHLIVDIDVMSDDVAYDEDPVTIECNSEFQYAVVSLPPRYFPNKDSRNPLAREEKDHSIALLPTYRDFETDRLYFTTSQFSCVDDPIKAFVYLWASNNVGSSNQVKRALAESIEYYHKKIEPEIVDALACLAFGAWTQDFSAIADCDIDTESAACLIGDTAGGVTPALGQFKAISDGVKYALNGDKVGFSFAAVSLIPGGRIAKAFKLEGKVSGNVLKVTRVASKDVVKNFLWTVEKRVGKGSVTIFLEEGGDTYGFKHILNGNPNKTTKGHLEDFARACNWADRNAIENGLKQAVERGSWAVPYESKSNNFIYWNTGLRGQEGPRYIKIIVGDNGLLKDSVITAHPINQAELRDDVAKIRGITSKKEIDSIVLDQ
jgi:hypothetical protein